jgi:hypothetical protein
VKKNLRLNIFLLILLSISFQTNIFSQEKSAIDSTKNISPVISDSTTQKKKREILLPIHIPTLLDNNLNRNVLSKNIFETNDYRYTADFFTNIPFGFVRDLGSIGQPSEVLLNGNGFSNMSFLSDGISLNNRLSNSFDLNHYQSECFGTLELVPLSMGFLFGSANNPAAVNFITRQHDSQKPFSRIKFYQAPNTEGFIDGIFCVRPFSKLTTYFEITNQGVNPYYTNSDLSNWLGSLKMNYLVSKELNILAGYRYFKTITQLNGGVDISQIEESFSASQINTILYDNLQAPVRFTNRYEKASGHNFNIHLLGNLFQNSFTDLTFYYQSYLTEFRQNEGETDYQDNATSIIDDNENKTIGLNLRHDFFFKTMRFSALANYEQNKYISPLLKTETKQNIFSAAGIASAKMIDSTFEPKLFVKYLDCFGEKYIGYGAHVALLLNNKLKLNAGFSSFEKPFSVYEENYSLAGIETDKQRFNVLELNGEYSNEFLNTKIGFFSQTINNSLLSAIKNDSLRSDRVIYFGYKDISLQGINLYLNLTIWKLLFYTNTSYYLNANNRKDYNVPEFTLCGGVYYVDTLFERNLRLKTGFNYYSVGPQNYSMMDFEKSVTSTYSWNPYNQTVSSISENLTPTSFQIDFFLAGKIRNAATIYFVFENLLNEEYYIMPYYPKQGRGLRFGVAWEFSD